MYTEKYISAVAVTRFQASFGLVNGKACFSPNSKCISLSLLLNETSHRWSIKLSSETVSKSMWGRSWGRANIYYLLPESRNFKIFRQLRIRFRWRYSLAMWCHCTLLGVNVYCLQWYSKMLKITAKSQIADASYQHQQRLLASCSLQYQF